MIQSVLACQAYGSAGESQGPAGGAPVCRCGGLWSAFETDIGPLLQIPCPQASNAILETTVQRI